jgi:putative transposase
VTLYQNKYRVESARLRDWDYRARGWYFVTICAQRRACILGTIADGKVLLSPLGRVAEAELQTLHTHYNNVQIDSFVVMPNHVHAIVAIDGEHCFSTNPEIFVPAVVQKRGLTPPEHGSLSAIIRSYKAGVTRRSHELGLKQLVWQSRFHDRLLRGDAMIDAVRDYIRNNPANWSNDENHP